MRFLVFLWFVFCSNLMAQDWPSKQIHLIVPFSADGNIGAEAVAKAVPDGHTLLLGFDGAMVINPHVYATMPIDILRDFVPVTKLGDAAVIAVAHSSVPAKDRRELIAPAKAKPDTLSCGTSGTGGGQIPLVFTAIASAHQFLRSGKLKALSEPAVKERFAVLGIEPVGNTPEEYAAQVRADFAMWEGVVKKAKIRIE